MTMKHTKPLFRIKKTNKTPMMYSVANRKQLIVSDMAHVLTLIYTDLLQTPNSDVVKIIKEASKHVNAIQQNIYGGGTLVLKNKDLAKYRNTITLIQEKVDSIMGFDANLRLGFISGIIAICSDMTQLISSKSNKPLYISAWNDLLSSLQKLYDYYDPNMTYNIENDIGCTLAKEINNIITNC